MFSAGYVADDGPLDDACLEIEKNPGMGGGGGGGMNPPLPMELKSFRLIEIRTTRRTIKGRWDDGAACRAGFCAVTQVAGQWETKSCELLCLTNDKSGVGVDLPM